jgi:hypothetical protein
VVSIKEKKERVVGTMKIKEYQMCMLHCRLVYGEDLPWVSKSPPTQQVAYQKPHSHTGNSFLYGGAKIKSIAIDHSKPPFLKVLCFSRFNCLD